MATANVTVADHPLIQHKLTLLRRTKTSTAEFRQLLGEIALLLAFEATRDLAVRNVRIETPLEVMEAPILDGKKLCLVSILRAGNGLYRCVPEPPYRFLVIQQHTVAVVIHHGDVELRVGIALFRR